MLAADDEERILPDYGLAEVGGAGDDDEAFDNDDTFGDANNDDTFGDAGEWQQGNEAALDMAQLHEDFMAGEAFAAGGGAADSAASFFGGDVGIGDFMLEDEPSLGLGIELDESAAAQEELELDAQTKMLLDEVFSAPSPEKQPPAKAAGRGLRVGGLPSNLDEDKVKTLLTHFGALGQFELQRGSGPEMGLLVAFIAYQDPSITETAAASLQGIPLGNRCPPSILMSPKHQCPPARAPHPPPHARPGAH